MPGGNKPTPVPPLTPVQKQDWNQFVDFVDKQGFKGNPLLDERDKNLGMYLMQKYKSLNPKTTITYQDVPRVQQELQDYRTNLIDQYKKGQIQPDAGVKTEDDIMPNLSPVDGWLGSKTSNHKFPVAMAQVVTPTGTQTTNYGTNVAAFDKEQLKK